MRFNWMPPRSSATVLKKSGVTRTRSVTTRSPLRSGMIRRLARKSTSPSCNNPAKDLFPAGINFPESVWSFVNRMRLRRQNALRLSFRDARRERLMRDGDVFRDIRDHVYALMDVLVQQVSTQLGIENTGRKHNQRYDRQNRDSRNKQISNDQAVAQTPQQAVSPPANQPEQKINTRKNRQIFQEAEEAAVELKNGCQQSTGYNRGGSQILPREAAPNFFEVSAEGCHRAVNGNNTLPESAYRMQSKRLIIGMQAKRYTSPPTAGMFYCGCALLTRL